MPTARMSDAGLLRVQRVESSQLVPLCDDLLLRWALEVRLRSPEVKRTLGGTNGRGPHNLGTWGALGSL